MRKKSIISNKLIALVLCLTLILQVIPISVYATDTDDTALSANTDSYNTEAVEIIGEDVSLRDAYTKHFRMSDGSITAYSYEIPVHFLDENGEWQDYDNTLYETAADDSSDKDYVNQTSDFKVRLSKKTNGKKFVRLEKDEHKISWYYEDAKKVTGKVTEKTADDDVTTLENIVTEAVYEDVFPDTDLQYIVSSAELKENIILKSNNAPNEFTAVYKCNSLTAVLADDKTIEFNDADGESVFIITAPYMVDADGQMSGQLAFEIVEQKNNTVTVALIADYYWINDPERKFPVTIDPVSKSSQYVEAENWDVALLSANNPDTVYSTEVDSLNNLLYLGNHASRGKYRVLVRIKSLPTLGIAAQVIDAKMSFYFTATVCETPVFAALHNVTSSWDASTVTWNNQPATSSDSTEVHTIAEYSSSTYDASRRRYFEITDLARQWYTNRTSNNGIKLVSEGENSPAAAYTTIRISGYSGDQDLRPQFEVQYRNMSGFEDYWSYTSVEAGRTGSVSVNNYNGNVTIMHPLTNGYYGSAMPVDICLVYNSNSINPFPSGLGGNNTTNYHTFVKCTNSTTEAGYNYYLYDSDGTKHWFYFEANSTTGEDEDGLGLTLNVDTTVSDTDTTNYKYTIIDKTENKMFFNGVGRLMRIQNNEGFTSDVTYTSDGYINTISTGDGNVFTFVYTDYVSVFTVKTLTSIITPDGFEYIYNYDWFSDDVGAVLTRIKYEDYGVYFEYYYSYITSISFNAYTTTINYSGSRASSIYSTENNEKYSFVYNQNTTEVTDILNRTVTYQFNDYGQTTGIVSNETGYAQFFDYYNGDTTEGKANRLLSQSNVFGSTTNYVVNPSVNQNISAYNSYFSSDVIGNKNIAYNSTKGHYANGSVEVYKENAVGDAYATQEITLSAGTYTLSAYVKTSSTLGGNGAHIGMQQTSTDGSVNLVSSEPVTTSDTWERISATYELTTAGAVKILLGIPSGSSGTVYFDDIQLEKGDGETTFNLVENSAFTSGTNKWVPGRDTTVSTVASGLAGFENAIKVPVLIAVDTNHVTQQINISGSAEDEFAYGMWVKAASAPIDNGTKSGDMFFPQFSVNLHYYDSSGNELGVIAQQANPDLKNEWQFVVGKAVIPENYSSISIRMCYDDNFNNCYFTGAFVYKQTYGEVYDYDVSGNLIEATSSIDTSSSNVYSNERLFKQNNPTGSGVMYTYNDTNKYRVDYAMATDGTQANYTYDAYGNVTGTTLKTRTPVTTLETEKDYFIFNAYNAQLMDSGLNADTCYLTTFRFDETAEYQMWRLEAVSGEENTYYIKNVKFGGDGYYLNVVNGSSSVGTALYLRKTTTLTPQKFKIIPQSDGTFEIYTGASNYSLLLDAQPDGGDVKYSIQVEQVSPDANNLPESKRWYFYPVQLDDENTITTSATYSDDGNYLKTTTDSLGNITTYDFDGASGLPKTITDAKGNSVNYSYYSNLSNKLCYISSGSSNILFVYDEQDNPCYIESTTAGYRLDYDTYGRLTKTILEIEGITASTLSTLQYGSNNLLSRQTYGNNQYVDFTYDNLDRLIKKTYNGSINGTLYSYNSAGQLSKVKDTLNGYYTAYGYDRYGRVLKSSTYTNHLMNANLFTKITCTYEDVAGRINSFAYKMLNSDGSTYRTSNFGIVYGTGTEVERVKGITYNSQNSLGYTYDSFGRLTRLNYSGISGTPRYAEYTYVTNSETKKTSTVVESITNPGLGTLSYTYDANGNITEIKKDGVVWATYTYDALNQLISSTRNGETTTYNYRENGNLYQVSKGDCYDAYGGDGDTLAVFFSFDLSTDTVSSEFSPTYDNIGNPLTYRNDYNFTWTNGRSLSEIRDSNNVLLYSYAYDADGKRISKTVNGVTTTFHYDGDTLIGQNTANGTVYTDITFLRDATGTIYGLQYGEHLYYFAFNVQGDVIGIYAADGTVVATYDYDDWGVCTVNALTADSAGYAITDANHIANVNPIRYRGYYYDAETGFYFLQSRYYDPVVRRFINADSYVSTGQGVLANNMFAYCGNNPVNRVDPTGQFWITALVVTAVVAVCTFTLSGCSSNNKKSPDPEPYSNQANCYAYAMKLENDPRTGRPFTRKPQPGEFSGNGLTARDLRGNSETVKKAINTKVSADAKVLNLNYTEVNSADHVPKAGNWVVALAYATDGSDYHWWRKNEDGTWSHKPGSTPIIHWDASGNTITDPGNCNRGIYDGFLGYYEVGPN